MARPQSQSKGLCPGPLAMTLGFVYGVRGGLKQTLKQELNEFKKIFNVFLTFTLI